MTQQYPSVASAIPGPASGAQSTEEEHARERRTVWWRSAHVQLVGCLLLAVALRLVVLLRSHGMMDSDEAVLGIQAEQILRGAHPIYFSGQAYMGSWDAYLLAPLVALFGPSAWVLHGLTLAESLLLVPLQASVARRLFGPRAYLPAALLAAFCPLYVTAGELRTLGGYVETLVLGAALLLAAVEIARRWSAGEAMARLWLLAGLLAGLGLWIDVLIVYYLAAAALWLAPHAYTRLRDARRRGPAMWRRGIVAGAGALVACAVGAAPAIVYAATHQLANVTLYLSPQGGSAGDPLRRGAAAYLLTSAAPRVAGAYLNWFKPGVPSAAKAAVYALAAGLALAAALYAIWRLLRRPAPIASASEPAADAESSGVPRWNYALPLLLCLTVAVIFWRSSFTDVAVAAVRTYGAYIDLGGRYALPLTTALNLLLAALVAGVLEHGKHGAALPALRRVALCGLAGAALFAYGAPYALADGVRTLQTPYWQTLTFPAEGDAVVGYLEQHGIHDVWVTHWIGNVVMYQSDLRVACADYQHEDVDRFPAMTAQVAAADRPSFLVQSDPALGEPATAKALDALGVRYQSVHFGRYWVLTPTSRTVAPAEIQDALNANTF